jgi:ATP/maltotriose-dependent transcriptional regulator MalT
MIRDYDQAAALFEESLALNRRINDQGMVWAELQNLGLVEIHRGNVDAAERYFAESERLGTANDPYATAMAQLYRAAIAFVRGNMDESRALLQRAESILREAKMDAGRDDQFEIDWLHEQLTKTV